MQTLGLRFLAWPLEPATNSKAKSECFCQTSFFRSFLNVFDKPEKFDCTGLLDHPVWWALSVERESQPNCPPKRFHCYFFFAAKTIKDKVRVALTSFNTFWVKFEAKQHVLFKMKQMSYLPTCIRQTTCELSNMGTHF